MTIEYRSKVVTYGMYQFENREQMFDYLKANNFVDDTYEVDTDLCQVIVMENCKYDNWKGTDL